MDVTYLKYYSYVHVMKIGSSKMHLVILSLQVSSHWQGGDLVAGWWRKNPWCNTFQLAALCRKQNGCVLKQGLHIAFDNRVYLFRRCPPAKTSAVFLNDIPRKRIDTEYLPCNIIFKVSNFRSNWAHYPMSPSPQHDIGLLYLSGVRLYRLCMWSASCRRSGYQQHGIRWSSNGRSNIIKSLVLLLLNIP